VAKKMINDLHTYGATCRDRAELKYPFKGRIVIPNKNFKAGLNNVVQSLLKYSSHLVPLYVSSSTVSGVTLARKCMYSSVWNDDMVSGLARFALYPFLEQTV
jgi:hypothetical protein